MSGHNRMRLRRRTAVKGTSFTEVEYRRVQRLFHAGRTANEVAEAMGRNPDYIRRLYRRLREHGTNCGKNPSLTGPSEKTGPYRFWLKPWKPRKIDPKTLPDRYYHSDFVPT